MTTGLSSPPAAALTSARDLPWWRRWWVGLAVAAAVLLLGLLTPLAVTDYYSMQLVLEAAILAILALSVAFLARHLGLFSLGHAAFYGGSAYAAAIATTHWGWSLTQAVVFAVAAGTALSALIGSLVVRASGMGFLMLTLAFGQALYLLVVQTGVRPITGGYDGLALGYPIDDTFFGLPAANVMDPGGFWPAVWGALVVVALLFWLIGRSRAGQVLEGIRENEERMRFSGFNTYLPKLWAFTVSGFAASVAGVLFAVNGNFVSPSSLSFFESSDALVAAIIGGVGLLLGPIVGAGLYTLAQSAFNTSGNLHLYMGIALVVVLLFLPSGITGGIAQAFRRLRRGRRRPGGRRPEGGGRA